MLDMPFRTHVDHQYLAWQKQKRYNTDRVRFMYRSINYHRMHEARNKYLPAKMSAGTDTLDFDSFKESSSAFPNHVDNMCCNFRLVNSASSNITRLESFYYITEKLITCLVLGWCSTTAKYIIFSNFINIIGCLRVQ